MHPRSTSILALCLAAVTGGIVWQRIREGPASSGAAVGVTAGKASARGESIHAGKPGAERKTGEAPAPMEEAAVAGCDPLGGQWLKTASETFEQTGRYLVQDLGLTDAQAGGLKEVLARREKQLQGLLTGSVPGDEKGDGEAFGKICALLRNKGLRDDLTGVLSPRQLAAFDAREVKRERESIEARAYRDLAELNAVVRLTDGQKQEVFGALMKHAPEKLEREADARAFMSLFYGALAADMNPADIRSVANLTTVDPAGNPLADYGSMNHLQRVEQRKAERIDHEIATLRGVLDDDQLDRYREHLEKEPPR